MIRLLAVDMDGTCLNSKKEISEADLSALRRAAEAGITVVPTTGRALCCLPHQLKGQDFYRYVISSNGGEVTDLHTGQSLHPARIPLDTGLRLLRACRHEGVGITGHIHRQYLVQGHPLMELGHLVYREDANYATFVHSLEDYARRQGEDFEELQFYFLTPGSRGRVERILSDFPELTVAYDAAYAEVFSAGTSKGAALRGLAESLNIDRAGIACVGDGENDLPMFAVSGRRFAVGNAVEALKEQSDVILPGHNESAVAEAVGFLLEWNRDEAG